MWFWKRREAGPKPGANESEIGQLKRNLNDAWAVTRTLKAKQAEIEQRLLYLENWRKQRTVAESKAAHKQPAQSAQTEGGNGKNYDEALIYGGRVG